ncbi:PepSY domain-containing protein [Lacimicrobium sp. SS2-24]|uniref:PepSY domain-containing protein n=1 Tax=Lacimicrobium sp. SS2-24 TaxID=2005569 RepID=UPI000B4A9715|nr:PepSY domain-containing protein [Lacimicrobium sp. SS2-24]
MKFWRKWHKWIGLILGIQVLLWISGGVVMSVIPIDMVRGAHLIGRTEQPIQPPARSVSLNFSEWRSWQWFQRPDQLALRATDFSEQEVFLDPVTALPLSMLSSDQIAGHATQQYLGAGEVTGVALLEQTPAEVRGLTSPLYRVDFSDSIHTSFYLHPYSGEVLRVRSDLWRLFDFFWMLHILDFENRTDFNNPLLISLAFVAWLFTLSGFVLLYHSLIKPNWRKLRYRSR